MDHLKEQLKKHYEKAQPREEFLQILRTLEAPEPAPAPVRMSRKRLLTPIAAMLIAAVAILGGGKYLMDAIPSTADPPESEPTAMAPVESAVGFEAAAPTDTAPDPGPDIMPTAPADPEPFCEEETPPEKSAPEPGSADVTAPQIPTSPEPTDPAPPSGETTDPVPPEDITNPVTPPQITEPGDDPTPPPEDDVPPTDPGDDDPPTDPGEDDPVDPPDDPVDPPDDPIYPEPHAPVISAYYANEDGQHIVYLTNRSTGESSPIDVTTWVTESGYHGTHNLFGYMIEVWLIPPLGDAPASDQNFHAVAEVIM